MRTIKGMMALAAGLLLSACGGGSDVCYVGPNNSACNTAASTATSLTLQLSSTSISNSGSDTVTATATAATAGGQTVSGVPVTFSVDSAATYTPSATETDASGVVTANVNIGADKANRTITVVAASGSLTATATFTVTGATLTSTAVPAVVAPSGAGRVDFILKDSAGNAMVGQPISVVGGAVAQSNGVTDGSGAYTFNFTAPTSVGTLSIVAKAGGVEKVQDVQVQTTNAVPPASATPTSATVAVNPSVVAPNVDTTTSYRAEVRALFLDASNRPIPNMRVRFSVNGYGSFSTGDNIVYSDANGVAVTGFIPAGRTSPALGVVITACYEKVDFAACGTNATTKALTIAADPLSISIGTDNKIVIGDLTYTQRFVVTAVDIAGRAKANVDITPSIDLQYYFKGLYVRPDSEWVQVGCGLVADGQCAVTVPITQGCANEDVARTGFYQQSQDINQNGQIDPRKSDVLISVVGSSKTDATGKAVLQIEYPKNVGSWVQYTILVSAGVAGTEGRASWVAVLNVPVTDVKAEGAPPFVRSPYGIVVSPAIPSVNFPPPAAPRVTPVSLCENAD